MRTGIGRETVRLRVCPAAETATRFARPAVKNQASEIRLHPAGLRAGCWDAAGYLSGAVLEGNRSWCCQYWSGCIQPRHKTVNMKQRNTE